MSKRIVELPTGLRAEFVGPEHISARLVFGSRPFMQNVDEQVSTLFTLELRYPRFIHAQLMTHRMFARNSASNRARSIAKPGAPPMVFYQPPARLRRSGMSVTMSCTPEQVELYDRMWQDVAMAVYDKAAAMERLGYAKEIVNRIIEPFQFIEVVMTGTYKWWQHFLALRNHPEAQYEIRVLASKIAPLIDLDCCERRRYHIPYVDDTEFWALRTYILDRLWDTNDLVKPADAALFLVSAARCARVSYTPFDERRPNVGKDAQLAARLLAADPPHMSPFEHAAVIPTLYSAASNRPLFDGWVTARAALEHLLKEARDSRSYLNTLVNDMCEFTS